MPPPPDTNDANTEQDKTTVSSPSAVPPSVALSQHALIDGIYKIEREIGAGGAGSVYQVQQTALKKTFALKVLHDTYSDIAMRRFHKEAQIAAGLNHPNLVRAVHSGTLPDGKPFYVMDFVSGMTLAERLEQGPLRPSEVIDVFRPLCIALDYAHAQGLVHRDLKPGNTVLTVESNQVVPKIIDFGIAHLALSETTKGANLTRTGEIFGTPKYMSPEQCLSKKVDQRSDIYSLGCMMFECLTGKVPYTGENAVSTIMLHVTAPLPNLREAAPDRQFARGWQELIDKMLAKEPEDRYTSCAQVAHALEAIRDNTVEMPSKRPVAKPVARSNFKSSPKIPIVLLICAAVFLTTAAGITLAIFSHKNPPASTNPFLSSLPQTLSTSDTKPRPADNALELAAKKYPVSETYLQKALLAARSGDWLNALTTSVKSLNNLQERLKRNSPDGASPEDNAALSIRDAVIAMSYLNNGAMANEAQRQNVALVYIGQAITLDPYVSEYLRLRGNINTKLGKKAEADEDFDAAKKLASQPTTDCDRIMRSITESSARFDARVSAADPTGQKYLSAKALAQNGQWKQAHDAFFALIMGLLQNAKAHDSAVDLRRCSLYYALASYSLYRQAETSSDSGKILDDALRTINDAIHSNGSPAEFYRIKSMILTKQHKDDLLKENDEILADKQQENGDPQVNDEVRTVLKPI